MKRRILIFAGAGASKAVSPDNYPTTADFFAKLPAAVTTNVYFELLLEYLRARSGGRVQTDIEVVLWHFQELRAQLKSMASTDVFLGWLLDGDRLNKPVGSGASLGSARHAAAAGLPLVQSLVDQINKQVFALYKRPPESAELEATWLPLLRKLHDENFEVELATTNYDVVLEYALALLESEGKGAVDAGWKSGVYRKLDLARWAREPFGAGRDSGTSHGLLTKVHGSVNWSRDGSEIFISDPGFKGQDDRHAIIYPGFKGRPTEEPFLTIHQYLARSLSNADILLFVGFAFRDEFINELCTRYVQPKSMVFVINPSTVTYLPFSNDSVVSLSKPFGKEAIDEFFGNLASIKLGAQDGSSLAAIPAPE